MDGFHPVTKTIKTKIHPPPKTAIDNLANDFEDEVNIEEEEDCESEGQGSSISKRHQPVLGNTSSMSSSEEENLTSSGAAATISNQKYSKLLYEAENQDSQHSKCESDASRLLRSKVSEEDEDRFHLRHSDDDNRMIVKTIMVGSDYQAVIPDGLNHYGDARPYENEDKLIWDPSPMTFDAIENYLRNASAICKPTIPRGKHLRDNEHALHLLQQCGHNVDEALRRLEINKHLYEDTMQIWSEEECRNFEAGIRLFGKNFYLTQQNKVRTRSVGELVQFYYLWKKTERHDMFANKVRLEKKKYVLHPGVTDFMDRFLEEHDSRDRSSSPNVIN